LKNQINFQKERNLQYNFKSIYYNIVYPANDITGTGDKLKDVPYKVLCKIMKCESGCCVGEIDNMRCGLEEDCKIYTNYSNLPGLVAAIIVPIGVFFVFLLLFIFLTKYKKYNCGKTLLICLACLFVVTIPIVIYFMIRIDKSVTPDKNIER